MHIGHDDGTVFRPYIGFLLISKHDNRAGRRLQHFCSRSSGACHFLECLPVTDNDQIPWPDCSSGGGQKPCLQDLLQFFFIHRLLRIGADTPPVLHDLQQFHFLVPPLYSMEFFIKQTNPFFSFMVRRAAADHITPVDLLQEDDAHKLMRKRHSGEAEPLIRPVQHLRRKPQGSADEKGQMTDSTHVPPFHLPGQLH